MFLFFCINDLNIKINIKTMLINCIKSLIYIYELMTVSISLKQHSKSLSDQKLQQTHFFVLMSLLFRLNQNIHIFQQSVNQDFTVTHEFQQQQTMLK